jgi:hypothetical protein
MGFLTPRQTGRLTVGRNITLALTFSFQRVAAVAVSVAASTVAMSACFLSGRLHILPGNFRCFLQYPDTYHCVVMINVVDLSDGSGRSGEKTC